MLPVMLPAGKSQRGMMSSPCPQPSSPASLSTLRTGTRKYACLVPRHQSHPPDCPIPWLIFPDLNTGLASHLGCVNGLRVLPVTGCFWGMHCAGKCRHRWLER